MCREIHLVEDESKNPVFFKMKNLVNKKKIKIYIQLI